MSSSNNLFGNIQGAASTAAAATDNGPQTQTQTQTQSREAEGSQAASVPEGNPEPEPQVSKLEMLKNRARIMGVSFGNNIGVDALKQKIEDHLSGEAAAREAVETQAKRDEEARLAALAVAPVAEPAVEADKAQGNPGHPVTTVSEMPKSLYQSIRERELALVRVRITNLDPKKKDLPGEILTVANEYLGTVRKYVPYGEVTDEGYHIPVCIYNQLIERTFVDIRVPKAKNGQESPPVCRDVREFSIEVLPPLTVEELGRLAAAQAAAAGGN